MKSTKQNNSAGGIGNALPALGGGGKSLKNPSIRLGSRLDEDSIVSLAKNNIINGNNANINAVANNNGMQAEPPAGMQKSLTSPRAKKNAVNFQEPNEQGVLLHASLKAIGEKKLVYQDIPVAEVKADYWNNNSNSMSSTKNHSMIVIEDFASEKEKSVIIATGSFRCKDKLITYTVRQVLGTCLSITLTVPLTGQNWVLLIPYTEELEHLLHIRTRQARENKKEDLNKLCSSIMMLTTVEFEDFVIVKVQFNGDEFRRRVIKELAALLDASIKCMQRFFRGFAIRKRFRMLVKMARMQKLLINKKNTRLYGPPDRKDKEDQDNLKKLALTITRRDNSSFPTNIDNNTFRMTTKTNEMATTRGGNNDLDAVFNSLDNPNQSQMAYNLYATEADRIQTANKSKTPRSRNTQSRSDPQSRSFSRRQTERVYMDNSQIDGIKQEINEALNSYQQQLEAIHNFIGQQSMNYKPLASSMTMGESQFDSQSTKWLKSPDKSFKDKLQNTLNQDKMDTSSVVESLAQIREVSVLQSELISVASKLENLEDLYERERKAKVDLEHKYREDIAKAKIAAEYTSDRVAQRIKGEVKSDHDNAMMQKDLFENARRTKAIEEEKELQEILRMGREEDFVRNFNIQLNYENRIKQMKIELYLRDTALEQGKSMQKSGHGPTKGADQSVKVGTSTRGDGTAATSAAASLSSASPASVATDSSVKKKMPTKVEVKPAESVSDATQPPKRGVGFFRSISKFVGGSSSTDPSSSDPPKTSLFDYIKANSRKTAFGLLWAKEAANIDEAPRGLSVEEARAKVQKFFIMICYQKRAGTMRDLKPIRLARQFEIVSDTTHVKSIVIALKTSMDMLNEELATMSLKRLVELISLAEQNGETIVIHPTNILVELLDMFNMKAIVCTLCLEVIAEYVKVNTKTDPSQEIIKNFGTSTIFDVLLSLTTLPNVSGQTSGGGETDHVMIFRVTKCLYLLSMSCDQCRNTLRKEVYVAKLILLFAAHTKNNGVIENLLKIFIRICTDDTVLQERLGNSEFIAALGTCFEVNLKVERLVVGICKLIVVMCGSNKKECQDMLSTSYYPVLFAQCITVYKTKPKLLEQVVWSMLSIVLNNRPAKRRFQDSGLLKKMLKLLDINKNGPSVVICGIWGIAQMTTAGRPALKEINEEIVKTLIELRDQQNHGEISRHAARLLIDTYANMDKVVEDSPPSTPGPSMDSSVKNNDAFLNGSSVNFNAAPLAGYNEDTPEKNRTGSAERTPIEKKRSSKSILKK